MMREKSGVLPRILLSGIGLLAFGMPAHAQEVSGAELEETRRYTVEVIIFRYAQDVSIGSERFLPEPLPAQEEPLDEDAGPLVSLPAVEPDPVPANEPAPLRDFELAVLPDAGLTMTDVVDRMERLDVYEPIMHFGWTQATWPDEETEPLPLSRFGVPPAGLDGTLELYLGRYLHLVVDLALDSPEIASIPRDSFGRSGRGTTGEMLGYLDEPVDAGPVRYRIREDRILRNGELRYYDHPKFGIVAKVTRVEEEDEAEDTELLGYGPE